MELTIHRHRGFDFYFITQYPSLLHPVVKALIGCHYHITRPYGRTPKIYRFGSCRDYPNTLVNKLNCEAKFDFKPQLRIFKLYKSTAIDTHKPRYPKGLIGWGIFIMMAVCLFLYSCSGASKSSLSPFKSDEPQDIVKVEEKPKAIQDAKVNMDKKEDIDVEQQELSRIAMIIDSSTDCYAKNSYGEIIDISVDECKYLSSKNNRLTLSKVKKELPNQDYQSLKSDENVGL